MTGTDRRSRRAGRVAIAVVSVLAVGGAAAIILVPRGDDRPADTANLLRETAEVTTQTLVDEQTEYGELGYGAATTLSGRLAGTVTGLPAGGSTVGRGQALYRGDNTPVVLLFGALPAYRTLSPGTEGADVEQLEQNLYAMGYRGFTVDDSYSESTADAVSAWQEDLGLPETGTVELGRVVYAAGEVRVDTLEAAVGDATQPGAALLTYTGTSRVVVVDLEMSDQRLAVDAAAVGITLPDGTTVPGKIIKTQTVIDPGSDDGGGETEPTTRIEVTVAVDDEQALAGLDRASLRVGFTASQRENVLTVPVAALLALAEGGYGVEVVDGSSTRVVAVETGLFADGRVEVSGPGLASGLTVGMPS